MHANKRLSRFHKFALICTTGIAFQLGGCNLGEFTSTSTVTLSGREVLQFLVRSWVLSPIQTAIDNGINNLFDKLEGEDE